MAIDLHIHSNFSDGQLSPEEIVIAAKKLAAISITDHDTIGAYDQPIPAGAGYPKVICGIEMTAFSPVEIHILGYFKEHPGKRFQEDLNRINLNRIKALFSLAMRLYKKETIDYTPEQIVNCFGRISPSLLFRLVSEKNRSITETVFYSHPALMNKQNVGASAEEVVAFLKQYGAVVSLAHPKRIESSLRLLNLSLDDLIVRLKAKGLTALECYHESYSEDDTLLYLKKTKEYNLKVTGGSDFHGSYKPMVKIGQGRGEMKVEDIYLDKLFA